MILDCSAKYIIISIIINTIYYMKNPNLNTFRIIVLYISITHKRYMIYNIRIILIKYMINTFTNYRMKATGGIFAFNFEKHKAALE